ncbi:metal ABC transporter substrate-binding protein [Ornithinibacillus massiliensis]|uniref:Metal ABC transporter substrate-binding protein n=1 Tax=Ornithinibacillus massiliensis TaxID=1944633 RepID=A0ABS5M9H4_9BACI|nr:metal ABC transporter substrate-binding protein [Ornithinibacillus massiliensis]MBS3678970.1 metal ABC transporter substrate-binding protein [Ornithinibacillus massiliensis]
MNITKKATIFLTIVVGSLLLLVGCGTDNSSYDNDKLNVVTTNSIIWDITENIAGDKVNLHSIVPVGKDPHEYEPLPDDIVKATNADIVFYNGLNLETGGNAWFTKLMQNANKEENKDYFAVSEGVTPLYLEGKEEAGKEDPHAWLNLENGIIYAQNIEKQLSEKDPENKAYYQENLANYVDRLKELDEEAKGKFDSIPANKKWIVTSEGCFKYFSEAYNIPSAYIWEINTEEEGTPNQIKNLVDKLRDTEVQSLFVESSVDDRPMKTISQETGIEIFSKVFTDSIAEEGEEGDSYYAMMKWNLDRIYEGLTNES